MSSFSLTSIRNLADSKLSGKEICQELVRLFMSKLQEEANEKLSNWSKESLTDFWCWLTDCQLDSPKQLSDKELSQHVRLKLSQILKRCDTDASLFRYIMKSVNNFASKDKDYFARFARAFYKKTREALISDDRFIAKHEEHVFFGLRKWGKAILEFCNELTRETKDMAKSLKEQGYFPVMTLPRTDAFIASKDLANASYRTLDYESFHFFCTLHAIFDLLNTSGQFGELIPKIVDIEQPDDDGKTSPIENLPSGGPLPSGMLEEGRAFARAFWQSLTEQEKALLAYYIIPKANGEKVARADVVSMIGFNNEVTMKNYETRLIEKLQKYCQEQEISSDPELCRNFMQELETMMDDLKIMKSGHSYMVSKEDK